MQGGIVILKLKMNSSAPPRPKMATPEEIERQISAGNAHVIYEGSSHFFDIEDEVERNVFRRQISLPDYEWFKETTGEKHWVLYNPMHFKIDRTTSGKKILKFNDNGYTGGRIELPVNASSCHGMFSWCTLPDNIMFGSLFNTRHVVDMDLMFAGCVMPQGFSLGRHFNTCDCKEMRYMFYQCVIPEGFIFDEKFVTDQVEHMEYMFSECKIPDGLSMPSTFSVNHVEDMNHMYYATNFTGKYHFGDNFAPHMFADTRCMFSECIIGGQKIDETYKEDFKYVKALLQ
ncbi:MAG: BspA family leucine-rich repeat surface protein [Eubacteriales bacterium]|nr:BspA family leucine-rich repeat surface protein [Lachnospiraceae bacterium]MDO5127011.1 BspA family leucine-rich repeat surface protein [Eubacteriales bacterium]